MKKNKGFHNINAIIIATTILVLDRISKLLISNTLSLAQSIPLINNILHFTLVHNTGAGFGILKGQRIFFIIFSIIVLAIVIKKWKKIPSDKNIAIPLGLILGGLFGNLFDRVFFGHVIDFIDFQVWPVFNIADSAITVAAVWLAIYLWKK